MDQMNDRRFRRKFGDIVPDRFGVGQQKRGGHIQMFTGQSDPRPTGNEGLPTRKPKDSPYPDGKPRRVTCVEYFWLDMDVPFTSVAGQQVQCSTDSKQFPLYVRGAWTDLVEQALIQLIGNASGIPISTEQVMLPLLAGTSSKVFPMLYWRRPYYLPGSTALKASLTNVETNPAGQIVFLCERPDRQLLVPVPNSMQYVLHLDLGLNGDNTQVASEPTQAIEYDLLIYGASTNVEAGDLTVRFIDSMSNNAWSSEKLPVEAFAGLQGQPQPIMYYPTPYYLPANSQIICEFANLGGLDTGYIDFICERILPA